MTAFVQVLTTTDTREGAAAIAAAVVRARAAACAQVVGPISSTYWWQGAIEHAEEYQLLMKTTEARYPDLEELVRGLHPYETPEIIATTIAGSAPYLAWIESETHT